MVRVLLLAALVLWPALAPAGSEAPRRDAACPELARISLYASVFGGFERLDICPPLIYSSAHPLAVGPRQGRVAGAERGTAYYAQTGAIQLSIQVDTASVPGMAQLLHAMVHVYQHEHGIAAAALCPRDLERQALEIQASFLRANGFDAEADRAAALARLNTPCAPRRDALR